MPTKYIPIDEFCALGLLQEINRLLLHPLGLALEVTVEDDGTERISGVADYRDDPEGCAFGEVSRHKAERVALLLDARSEAREAALGYVVQPLPLE